jgi:hypothetical protein
MNFILFGWSSSCIYDPLGLCSPVHDFSIMYNAIFLILLYISYRIINHFYLRFKKREAGSHDRSENS